MEILQNLVLAHFLHALAHQSLGHFYQFTNSDFILFVGSSLENYFILWDSDTIFYFFVAYRFYNLLTFSTYKKILLSFLSSLLNIESQL